MAKKAQQSMWRKQALAWLRARGKLMADPSSDQALLADLVARRIVMDRRLWDQCVELASLLGRTTPGEPVSPTDLAAMALEEGVKILRRKDAEGGR